MTDMLQKSENVAKNIANKNSQDLTEQWKKGELPSGEYYIIDDLGLHTTDRYYPSYGFGTELPQSVLGRVPSYDELQNMNKAVNECMAANIKLVEKMKALNGNMDSVMQTNQALCKKLAELKELLKECRGSVATLLAKRITEVNSIKQKELLTKIDEVLGEK